MFVCVAKRIKESTKEKERVQNVGMDEIVQHSRKQETPSSYPRCTKPIPNPFLSFHSVSFCCVALHTDVCRSKYPVRIHSRGLGDEMEKYRNGRETKAWQIRQAPKEAPLKLQNKTSQVRTKRRMTGMSVATAVPRTGCASYKAV